MTAHPMRPGTILAAHLARGELRLSAKQPMATGAVECREPHAGRGPCFCPVPNGPTTAHRASNGGRLNSPGARKTG